MTYTGSQNYTNMVVGKHGIRTFDVVVVVLLLLLLLFDVFVLTSSHPSIFLDKWFVRYTYMMLQKHQHKVGPTLIKLCYWKCMFVAYLIECIGLPNRAHY
jgi:hypothetical protein